MSAAVRPAGLKRVDHHASGRSLPGLADELYPRVALVDGGALLERMRRGAPSDR